MKFVETEADIQVKDELWASTMREIEKFAMRYLSERIVGVRETEAQKEVVYAAKRKGYPMGIIRKVASFTRRGKICATSYELLISRYRSKIGL